MEISEINRIFEKFSQMQVVVIGDSMIDSYLWGKVERVSPEAPVPVVSVTKRENRLGGAGNVSLNLKALGATPYLFSVIGNDDKGRKFKKLLAKEELPGDGIFEDSGRVTTVKSRIISNGQQIVKSISLFKPNFKEFVHGLGSTIDKNDFAAIKKAALTFKQKQNIKLIFITLSELGVLISNGTEEQHYPAIIRDIADVSGAGDTVISVAGLAMAAGLNQKTMAFMSNLAGGLVCEKVGVVPINKEQLIQEMKSQNI